MTVDITKKLKQRLRDDLPLVVRKLNSLTRVRRTLTRENYSLKESAIAGGTEFMIIKINKRLIMATIRASESGLDGIIYRTNTTKTEETTIRDYVHALAHQYNVPAGNLLYRDTSVIQL